jgi:hypothetical protein
MRYVGHILASQLCVAAVLSSGCGDTTVPRVGAEAAPPGPIPLWEDVRQVGAGKLAITVGMSKEDVTKALERHRGNQFGLRAGSPFDTSADLWMLSSGGRGAAPGGRAVKLYFENGRVVRISQTTVDLCA